MKKNHSPTQICGLKAEKMATEFLLKKGLTLIDKNFQTRHGEIDLIMHDQKTLVFVEVRYRRNTHYGSGAESINFYKQKRLVITAQIYLQKNPTWKSSRFDVISINSSEKDEINWIQDAFQVQLPLLNCI